MGRKQQKQGYDFEREVIAGLNDLQEQGRLEMVNKLVNAVGTPADFLVTGHNYTYLIECKSLLESEKNKAYTFALRHLTSNEWCGMRAWMSEKAHRAAWVVWSMKMLGGQRFFYALKFERLEAFRRSGGKVLSLEPHYVTVIASTEPNDLWRLFEEYEEDA